MPSKQRRGRAAAPATKACRHIEIECVHQCRRGSCTMFQSAHWAPPLCVHQIAEVEVAVWRHRRAPSRRQIGPGFDIPRVGRGSSSRASVRDPARSTDQNRDNGDRAELHRSLLTLSGLPSGAISVVPSVTSARRGYRRWRAIEVRRAAPLLRSTSAPASGICSSFVAADVIDIAPGSATSGSTDKLGSPSDEGRCERFSLPRQRSPPNGTPVSTTKFALR